MISPVARVTRQFTGGGKGYIAQQTQSHVAVDRYSSAINSQLHGATGRRQANDTHFLPRLCVGDDAEDRLRMQMLLHVSAGPRQECAGRREEVLMK